MSLLTRDHVLTEPTTEVAPGRHAASSSEVAPVREGSRDWGRLAVLAAMLLIAGVNLWNLNGWPIFIDDEGTYTAQAWAVLDGRLAHYQYWYDHPPAGWIQLGLFLGIPSLVGIEPTVAVARYVMVAYTLVSALLVFRLCRNIGAHRATAIAAMLLWGLSPLMLAQGRQVTLDTLTLPWILGALVLATSRSRALWQHVAAGACVGVAVLTKETALLVVPAVAVALWSYSYRPTRAFSLVGATVMLGVVGSVYPLFALIKNELFAGDDHVSVQDGIAFQLLDRPGSGTVLQEGSGVRELVDGWLYYEHTVVFLGLAAAVVCLLTRRWRCIGVLVAVMVVVALRPGGYVPAMFIIGVLPFLSIAVALVGQSVVAWMSRLKVRTVPVGAIAAGAVVLGLVGYAAPTWADRTEAALTIDYNQQRAEALDWMTTNLPKDSRILVDDSYWNDFVTAGWSGDGWSGPIWYYKLDLDPQARDAELPRGWRDVDYMVMSRTLTDALRQADVPPQLKAAYDDSVVIQRWGTGVNAVELRRIGNTDVTEPTGVPTS